MVVVSAAIVAAKRVLLCRQFLPVSRSRVDVIYSQFLSYLSERLVNVASVSDDQSKTTWDAPDGTVRYLFSPEDEFCFVLVTDSDSNIFEDERTLLLFKQVVLEQCGLNPPCEATILELAFDIVFALDEMIAPGGTVNPVTAATVSEYLLMDSKEEQLYLENLKRLEEQEVQKRKQKMRELDRERVRRAEEARASVASASRPAASLASTWENFISRPSTTTYEGPEGTEMIATSSGRSPDSRTRVIQVTEAVASANGTTPGAGMRLQMKRV